MNKSTNHLNLRLRNRCFRVFKKGPFMQERTSKELKELSKFKLKIWIFFLHNCSFKDEKVLKYC